MNIVKKLNKLDNWYLLYGIIILHAASQFFMIQYVITDELFYNSYSEMLPAETIENMLTLQDKYKLINYLLLTVVVPLRIGYVAVCINTGMLFNDYDINFSNVFKSALIAEYILIIGSTIQIVWIILVHQPNSLQAIDSIAPLSLYSFDNLKSLPEWLHVFLRKANVLEFIYIAILSSNLTIYFSKNKSVVFFISTLSYLIGLFIVLLTLTFLTL